LFSFKNVVKRSKVITIDLNFFSIIYTWIVRQVYGEILRKKAKILIVDDYPDNHRLIKTYFVNEPYEIVSATNGHEALYMVENDKPDLILLDIVMPGMDGFEVCKRLKDNRDTFLIPVVMITALEDASNKIRGIELGVDDFITKPIQLIELKARVASLLKVKRFTDELENAEKIIISLALAVESRDENLIGHCNRLANYGALLAEKMGIIEEELEIIRKGAILHDIGKVSISDHILMKPAPLTKDEFEIIKSHPLIGERICKPLSKLSPVLPIIRSHQERFNGTGYPDGLCGKQIPLNTHIVSIVDCYDALTSNRPYREALSKEEALRVLCQEAKDGLWDLDLFHKLHEIVMKEGIEEKVNENTINKYYV
jgi:putative two-component system response regulator